MQNVTNAKNIYYALKAIKISVGFLIEEVKVNRSENLRDILFPDMQLM